jgi:branched-chain amino acid transport system substrate-binding protein
MSKDFTRAPIKRRTVLQAGLAIGAAQIASPFVVKSLADEPVKIGLDNPLTGTYAALGKNELIGAQLALSQINAKGGILGRQVQLPAVPGPERARDATEQRLFFSHRLSAVHGAHRQRRAG